MAMDINTWDAYMRGFNAYCEQRPMPDDAMERRGWNSARLGALHADGVESVEASKRTPIRTYVSMVNKWVAEEEAMSEVDRQEQHDRYLENVGVW